MMGDTSKITTPEMELALASHFKSRVNLVVPNVSWGLGFKHELDLLVATPAGYLSEIEIKVSRSDLLADKKKWHGHYDPRIKNLWFAVTEDMGECLEHIPERAGLIVASKSFETWKDYYLGEEISEYVIRLDIERKPKINTRAKPISSDKREKLLRLAYLRVWSLKHKIQRESTPAQPGEE